MDIFKAIKARSTVRAFNTIPVSKEILQELLDTAIRAPSWANTQTWEFAVVGGEVMEKLKQVLVAKALANDDRHPDITRAEWPSLYQERGKENIARLYQLMGLSREDKEKQSQWTSQMMGFFGAPSCVIVYTEKGINNWALFNLGLVVENISLAAQNYGLGTAILAAVVGYPKEVKQLLNIPESKQLVVGIAIGYPDPQAKVNEFRSSRVPLETISSWYGFEDQ
jgi:nitroreductase